MLKQDIEYFAYLDLEPNYRALVQAIFGVHKLKGKDKSVSEIVRIGTRSGTNIKNKRLGHSQEDIEKMARLREFGDHGEPMTYTAIGKLFGCSDHVVYAALKRNGLLKKGLRGGNKPRLGWL